MKTARFLTWRIPVLIIGVMAIADIASDGILLAEVQQEKACMATTVPPGCGCPTSEIRDRCAQSVPPPGQSCPYSYKCSYAPGYTCEFAGQGAGMPCGAVHVCNWNCTSECKPPQSQIPPPPPGLTPEETAEYYATYWNCNPTTKPPCGSTHSECDPENNGTT